MSKLFQHFSISTGFNFNAIEFQQATLFIQVEIQEKTQDNNN
jgi:hypothetical protein